MAAFLYQCPHTQRNVQGWVADDAAPGDVQTYVSITCLACGMVHLVNPKNGRTASTDEKK